MAHLDFKITYNVAVDTDELRVLLAALTGKLKTEEERATARALGDRLWELRRTRALAWSDSLDKGGAVGASTRAARAAEELAPWECGCRPLSEIDDAPECRTHGKPKRVRS